MAGVILNCVLGSHGIQCIPPHRYHRILCPGVTLQRTRSYPGDSRKWDKLHWYGVFWPDVDFAQKRGLVGAGGHSENVSGPNGLTFCS